MTLVKTTVSAISNWLLRVINQFLSWLGANYRSPYIILGACLLVLVILGAFFAYRILNPPIIVTPDIHPFQSVEEYQSFIENKPLITAEAPQDEIFTKSSEIRDDKSVVYYIELSQRPIKPQMDMAYVQSYLEYLQASQDQAKEWMRSLGQDPDKLNIVWRPNPAEMRSKMLGESTKTVPQKDSTTAPTPTPTPQPTTPTTPRFPL